MKRIASPTVLVVCAFLAWCRIGADAFQEVVNVPGTSNVYQYVVNPVPITLSFAGTYDITPVEPPYPGAMYTAYSFYSNGGLWNWEVEIEDGVGPGRKLLLGTYKICCSYSPQAAFEYSSAGGSFTITMPETVYAGVGDSYNGDNLGGVSFLITSANSAVPEASTWTMMIIGFGGLGFAWYRKWHKRAAQAVGM